MDPLRIRQKETRQFLAMMMFLAALTAVSLLHDTWTVATGQVNPSRSLPFFFPLYLIAMGGILIYFKRYL